MQYSQAGCLKKQNTFVIIYLNKRRNTIYMKFEIKNSIEKRKNMRWRAIIFGIIIIICIASINIAIYWMITQDKIQTSQNVETTIDVDATINRFTAVFDNTIDYQEYVVSGVSKKDSAQELVYTKTQAKESVDGKYEMNVNIPALNISTSIADSINEQIYQTFHSKVSSLTSNTQDITLNQQNVGNKSVTTTIYNVQYKAYVNSNILSLVIKATLKDGVNQQRIMVKTYNYNLTTNEEIKLNQLKEIKGVSIDLINQKIQQTIKQANIQAENLANLGYSVLYREPTDEIYNIEISNDSINCFLGENGTLYIIYPYGNRETTSEMDIIVFE